MNIPESVYDLYKLKNCINPNQLYWNKLVLTKNAVPFIEKTHTYLEQRSFEKSIKKSVCGYYVRKTY